MAASLFALIFDLPPVSYYEMFGLACCFHMGHDVLVFHLIGHPDRFFLFARDRQSAALSNKLNETLGLKRLLLPIKSRIQQV